MLTEKSKAPAFALPDQDGVLRSLRDYTGNLLLIYFYPKDDTPGCTKEACAITEVYDEFESEGVTVLGVSADSPERHTKFRAKYNLPFTLLSDKEKKMVDAYGARNIVGGISRISYLIDAKGAVLKAYSKVSPTTHALEILADVRALKNT